MASEDLLYIIHDDILYRIVHHFYDMSYFRGFTNPVLIHCHYLESGQDILEIHTGKKPSLNQENKS